MAARSAFASSAFKSRRETSDVVPCPGCRNLSFVNDATSRTEITLEPLPASLACAGCGRRTALVWIALTLQAGLKGVGLTAQVGRWAVDMVSVGVLSLYMPPYVLFKT